jgi:hypothetical protein
VKKSKKAKDPKKFMAELATNPEKLGRFIKAPDKVMAEEGVAKQHMKDIKNAVAHSVHQKLASHPNALTAAII